MRCMNTCANLSQIFQLLLPEVETSDEKNQGAFILLLILTAIAPFLSWASHLARVKPAVDQEQRCDAGKHEQEQTQCLWPFGMIVYVVACFRWFWLLFY